MVAIVFLDGTRMEAQSWSELELQLREDLWNPDKGKEFREEFRLRAMNWSGSAVRTESSSEDFFSELEQAGLLRIDTEGELR